MSEDIIVADKDGVYHHGKSSNRIYLLKLNTSSDYNFIEKLENLAIKFDYTKIIAKIPAHKIEEFKNHGFAKEAVIPSYYKGLEDCFFMSKYYCKERSREKEPEKIKAVINVAEAKEFPKHLSSELFEIKILAPENIFEIAALYKKVFESYPFPIFDTAYLQSTMLDNIIYFGAFKDNILVACSSCETDTQLLNCEMTDFAVLPEYRGNNLASLLLRAMEIKMKSLSYKTLYSIVRSYSYGINCTFGENNYAFGGTLHNNTQICGSIESMNVWYKSIG